MRHGTVPAFSSSTSTGVTAPARGDSISSHPSQRTASGPAGTAWSGTVCIRGYCSVACPSLCSCAPHGPHARHLGEAEVADHPIVDVVGERQARPGARAAEHDTLLGAAPRQLL